ncbi:hypothetical protein SAMN05421504_102925 [Amycolatopsis xylanica]|uniref:Nucleotidyl transferase AbiEii toxin, Type IV TA system n=1 Tax=Amycolatopsis xylanica TaxID=589385 RepID=A0A1H3AH25_9PSEU|nr:hypothetical protein [Amycolatopsis xylanica]SDX29027.1 hypothetical protein SAMN05421504_102925 [Amycolatopsis xylanica]
MSRRPEGIGAEHLTVVARRVLLDGLCALKAHLGAITVVGAQAVHLRTSHIELASGAYTSDGDLALDPERLVDEPLLEEALRLAGFELIAGNQPGLWSRPEIVDGIETRVELDLLVGSTLAAGGRGARLRPHDKMSARKVPGLETAVVDRSPLTITSLETGDDRSMTVHVAGPASLFVAKAHKLKDRFDDQATRPDRLSAKDAGDVYRLMAGTKPADVAANFGTLLADPRVGDVTATGLQYLRRQFGGTNTPGVRLAVEALAGTVPETRIRALVPAYIGVLPHV